MNVLEIKNLSVEYCRQKKIIPAVRDVSLSLKSGEILGVVGESGCGKSTLALAILRLIPENEGKITSGQILFDESNLLEISKEELRKTRGKDISIIFQDPYSSLNPVLSIKEQIEETLEEHLGTRDKSIAKKLLEQVRIPEPERFYNSYPHQLSGGQRQRIGIAMAISAHPKIIIADEPTTALDVTIQKEILELLCTLQKEMKMSIILITHNLGIVANICQTIAVMYAGEIVEMGPVSNLIHSPLHPYTQGLLKSLPEIESKKERLPTLPGQPPDMVQLPSGCIFHPRCNRAFEKCSKDVPNCIQYKEDQYVSCHLWKEK